MKKFINFFINIGKLKGKERRGWRIHQIKEAESTASHIFRMTILSWLLAKKEKLNIEKVLKMALIHDLCEVFTEDETPYDPLLPKEVDSKESQIKIKEALKKWPEFSLEQKREKEEKKFKREYKAFLKLIGDLPSDLKEELENLWLDFEKRSSPEGRFVRQADKAENLLQGLEYWKEQGKIQKDLWIRWAKEIFDLPVFVEFIEAIERRFLKRDIFGKIRKKEKMDKILDFLIEVGKLKRMPKKGLVLIGMKNPRTVGDHIFHATIMGWFLAKERKMNFNIEQIIKIALVHDICEVYAGDITPYDKILPKDEEKWPELFDKWPRFSSLEKRKNYLEKYKREKTSLVKLISKLPSKRKNEFLSLWLDFEERLTKEGRFFKQVDRLATLLQALEFARETKKPPFKSWWIGSKEKVDDPLLIKFMEELGRQFPSKSYRPVSTTLT